MQFIDKLGTDLLLNRGHGATIRTSLSFATSFARISAEWENRYAVGGTIIT